MNASEEEDDSDLPEVDKDTISTGAAADSADWSERLKGLPRLLRYAALIITKSEHIEQRLVAEIDVLCPGLPLKATWASAFDLTIGLALADQLDHRAVVSDEPELRSLADSVRLLSLPVPRNTAYFETYRRVGKALVRAFRRTTPLLETLLRAQLEGFVFAFAALPACTDLLPSDIRAADGATTLAPLMTDHRISVAQTKIWRQIEKRRKEEEESRKAQAAETNRQIPILTTEARGRSLVVARLSDADLKSTRLKDILAPLKDAINEPLPLIEAPPLGEVQSKLMFEFPHAANVIDFALADLVGRSTVYLRPLLLVGDPGGGKSRFARRLGEELGVSVWRTDASQADGAVFAGTSRRWQSAEPCHPFLAIVQGKVANPVVLIDEIEKAASRSDYGRLWDSLLGFLEPETNSRYPDPALQTNLDLSQVSYIATANRLDPLPSPIRDRFRIVTFPIPTASHLDALLHAVIADLTKERLLDPSWITPLNGMERLAAAHHWRGGSVRRLRAIVEAILHARDAQATRH